MANARWEYTTLKVDVHGWFGPKVDPARITEQLNQHGREGWELVSAFDVNHHQGNSSEIVLLFKRPGR